MENRLEINDLNISFKRNNMDMQAVCGLQLNIGQGEVVALVGESGCGKSQSARAILGLLAPNAVVSGTIKWRGQNLIVLSDKEMQKIRGKEIALIFQEPKSALHPVLTIEKQMCEGLRYHQGLSKKAAIMRSQQLLSAVKIADVKSVMKSYPFQLSVGMCQRIMIAMAIGSEAKLWIADEITSSLDVIVQADILHLLKSIQKEKGISMLFITHDLRILPDICDRVAIMEKGRIVEELKCKDLFSDIVHHPYTQKMLEHVRKLDGFDCAQEH